MCAPRATDILPSSLDPHGSLERRHRWFPSAFCAEFAPTRRCTTYLPCADELFIAIEGDYDVFVEGAWHAVTPGSAPSFHVAPLTRAPSCDRAE
ncbi:MAG: hypothetical protein ABI910_07835 [Gemmatimonadota bacterium]